MARAVSRSMSISFKQSIEICNFIRNKKINKAKNILNEVIAEKGSIPFKRFNSDVGHKKKWASGRYPKKASQEILGLINLVEANAQFKGLNTSNLVITHINANKGPTTPRYGRQRSRKAKRTSIEIVVSESKKKVEKKPAEKVSKEDATKKKVTVPKEKLESKTEANAQKKQVVTQENKVPNQQKQTPVEVKEVSKETDKK